MAELADAVSCKLTVEKRAGSSPAGPTKWWRGPDAGRGLVVSEEGADCTFVLFKRLRQATIRAEAAAHHLRLGKDRQHPRDQSKLPSRSLNNYSKPE